ncbi:MAG: T9SS type A sorting domain-containing protein [Bacteroidota bacterium]|nr:T9SS type A sorting domain-containing protein [Bacteroidota bacterium]
MRTIAILPVLLISQFSIAQLSVGERPYEWDNPMDRRSVPVMGLGPIEVPQTTEPIGEDGFDYGVQRFVEVDIPARGEWETLPDGWQLCRIAIESPDAIMISLQFDRWELPEGALVYVYNDDRSHFIGGFDHTSRAPDGTMATAVVPGDELIVEYRIPPSVAPGELRISSITHGYRDLFGFRSEGRDYDPGYQSSPCHINVNCPEAEPWADQKRAVFMFLRPSGAGCTGVLLNNTAEPGRPYIHVANHCYQADESQWVFYFNYEAPGCVGSSGPTDHTLTGATLRSLYYYDDLVLLELFDTPPADFNVYYAGWDRSGDTPVTGTVIHHPLYDVKKITFNTGSVTSYVHNDFQTWRNYWTQGIMEAVSSGAPMFDQNKRMVGHMLDGGQDCSNAATAPTYCAKFSESWDGSSASTRLRDWLDPANTTITLDGYDPNAIITSMTATDASADPLIYPNPATDQVVFELAGTYAERIEVMDATGRCVGRSAVMKLDRTVVATLHWPGGLYFYRVIGRNGVISEGKILLAK